MRSYNQLLHYFPGAGDIDVCTRLRLADADQSPLFLGSEIRWTMMCGNRPILVKIEIQGLHRLSTPDLPAYSAVFSENRALLCHIASRKFEKMKWRPPVITIGAEDLPRRFAAPQSLGVSAP
jgi:hypothetical protein